MIRNVVEVFVLDHIKNKHLQSIDTTWWRIILMKVLFLCVIQEVGEVHVPIIKSLHISLELSWLQNLVSSRQPEITLSSVFASEKNVEQESINLSPFERNKTMKSNLILSPLSWWWMFSLFTQSSRWDYIIKLYEQRELEFSRILNLIETTKTYV